MCWRGTSSLARDGYEEVGIWITPESRQNERAMLDSMHLVPDSGAAERKVDQHTGPPYGSVTS